MSTVLIIDSNLFFYSFLTLVFHSYYEMSLVATIGLTIGIIGICSLLVYARRYKPEVFADGYY